MTKMNRNKLLFFILSIGMTFLVSCIADEGDAGDEEARTDRSGPAVTIISPHKDFAYLTSETILLNGTATDNFEINSKVIIYDTSGQEVFRDEQATTYSSPHEISTTFSTNVPGDYLIRFLFRDGNKNVSRDERRITIKDSEN